jgi:hypothetical protein
MGPAHGGGMTHVIQSHLCGFYVGRILSRQYGQGALGLGRKQQEITATGDRRARWARRRLLEDDMGVGTDEAEGAHAGDTPAPAARPGREFRRNA